MRVNAGEGAVMAERRRFFDLSRMELERRGVRWAMVSGTGPRRYQNVLAAIGKADGG